MKTRSAPNGTVAEAEKELLHLDLMIEILKWLPVKCLIKFKCVCKLWFEVIQEECFISKHLQVTKCTCLYTDEGYSNMHGGEETFSHLDSIDGLLLERSNWTRKYRIRNPETRQILDLPDPHPHGESRLDCQLFYDRIAGKYKLLYIYKMRGENFGGCKVLTMDSELKWRELSFPSLNYRSSRNLHHCFSFVGETSIYYVIMYDYSEIVCIEIESACFVSVKIPEASFSDSKSVQALIWEENFSLVKLEEDKDGEWTLKAWLLEDQKKQKWAEEKIVIPLEFMRNHANAEVPDLMGVTDNWLRLFIDGDYTRQHWYDIESKKMEIEHAPPGKTFRRLNEFFPSLVHLEGMRREAKKHLDG